MSSIYSILNGCLSGKKLTLPASAFGSGGIEDVISKYFGTELIIDNVSLDQKGSDVDFSNATISSDPLKDMTVDASFTENGGNVTMKLTATPPSKWNFAKGWSLLEDSWITTIGLSKTSFTLISEDSDSFKQGLNFDGSVSLGTAWSAFLWLLNNETDIHMSGPIDQKESVPVFDFSTQIGSTVSIPPFLKDLSLSLKMSCTAVESSANGEMYEEIYFLEDGNPITPKWVPELAFGLVTDIKFTSTIDLPIFIDLRVPTGGVIITADLSKVSEVAFSDFASLFPGVDFLSSLPSTKEYDPGTNFTFQDLSFAVQPSPAQLAWVSLTLGTTKAWTVTDNISVGPIHMMFQIAPSTKKVSATLDGLVSFTGGAIQLGAYYPGFTFTGNLTEGSKIDVTALTNKLLPIDIGAQLTLDELNFVVTPTSGDFSLVTALVGDWSIPVGLVTIDLTKAWMDLERSKGTTTGAIGIEGALNLKGQKDPITFDGAWNLPGTFLFNANFPDVNLTSLADTLSGGSLPSGVPEVALTDGALAVALNTTTKEYTFSLATSASINSTSIGTGLFQVRKTPSGYGYIVGFAIPESWSPGDIWSPLSDLFSGLSFSNSGLLLSSMPKDTSVGLPNMKMPSLPATVNPGFVFFSTLSLSDGILGPLQYLFKDGVSFNLFAQVDTADPVNSVFKATLPIAKTTGSLEFKEISVELRPGKTSFSISAEIILTVQSEKLTLKGTGEIVATPPSAAFTIEIDDWKEPLGIEGLTIDEFGLQVKIESAGVTIGFLGSFIIGTSPRTFKLVVGGELIDFEVPGAIVFELENQRPSDPLMLSDLITQFTSLDLSKVPVLDKIGFNDLEFWVVDDPSGFKIGDYTFPPGIGVAADIFIYTWEAKFDIQVNADKGIIASGSINDPITIAGIFSLSDTTGKKGPSGSIDTTAFTSSGNDRIRANTRLIQDAGSGKTPYLSLDGKVQFLGITESIKAEVASDYFNFELKYDFFGAISADLQCALKDATNFAASASCNFDLNVDVGPYEVAGVTLIPHIQIDGPGAAFDLAVTVNPTVIAELSVGLKFTWASLPVFDLHFDISLKEIANDLSKLYDAVIQWLKDNVGEVFADILSDVKKWVNAVKTVFTDLAKDISKVASALADYFKTAAADAAAFLKDLAFGFMEIVDALVKYFALAYDAAVKIVEALWHDCGMDNAFNQAETNTQAFISGKDLEFEFSKTEKGQQILMITRTHSDEISKLLNPYASLQQQLEWYYSAPDGGARLERYLGAHIAALKTIEDLASPELRNQIESVIPILAEGMDKRHNEYFEFLKS